ncbi:MAG: hypothetical protein ACRBBP_10800 [Bdellovibrionales bacterium]
MKALKLLILSLASLFLINCDGGGGSADKAVSTNGQELRGTPTVQAQSAAEIAAFSPTEVTWGRVSKDDTWGQDTQVEFDAHLKSFLSPQMLESEIGTVSGEETNSETGIGFWGRNINYTVGAFTPGVNLAPGEDVFNGDSAELRISIYQKMNDGSVQEVPVHFNDPLNGKMSGELVDSFVDGPYVQLIFADSYGKVSLSGFVETDPTDGIAYYKGQVLFRNLLKKNADGTSTEVTHDAEVLGEFKIKACGFFSCSQ